MELAFGRAMFEKFGRYAADPADIADLLEADVRQHASPGGPVRRTAA